MNQGMLTNKPRWASFLPILAMERAPKKVPRRLVGVFFYIYCRSRTCYNYVIVLFFFATFLEDLISLKNIHSNWLSERIKPHLSFIASVIMSVMILQ